ncbi:Brix-domain-containing protein [Polychaeton citri CBS 116435]|uniref:Ribosome production factor 2 homolog n=1 Tax=Polychaeton citri CBS 116435 TaxID=1314669 RepID=A0A9P4UT68_9PEZI|nr:Brix-domain-containing protein [Polychaeton citri CBS 116435]
MLAAKMLPLRKIEPKNARSKRFLDNKGPQVVENPRQTLFLRYTSCSEILQLVMKDLYSLKRPLAVKFSKKNDIHPFEDPSSLEFFSEKNDTSLIVFASHSKKRPHCLTLMRNFDFKVLDMIELMIDAESMRTISQFKNSKPAVGLKPMLSFSGSAFDSPTENAYTLAKSLLTDLFKGPDVPNVDVEGLQYMIHFTVDEAESEESKPVIHMRGYLIKTKKGTGNLPKVEVEEMGPRLDFKVGRTREADSSVMKEAMRKPKSLEAKTKKNIDTDTIGDKVGRIHLGRQDLSQLQTRKMKGLKRGRDEDIDEDMEMMEDEIIEDGSDDDDVMEDFIDDEPEEKRARVEA